MYSQILLTVEMLYSASCTMTEFSATSGTADFHKFITTYIMLVICISPLVGVSTGCGDDVNCSSIEAVSVPENIETGTYILC